MIEILKELFFEGVKSVNPYFLVKENIYKFKEKLKEKKLKKIIILSFGKAAYQMTKAAIEELEGYEIMGIVITKYGHISEKEKKIKNLKFFEAGHPLPDLNGLIGTKKILKIIGKEKKNTLFLNLISGGSSSLLVAPRDGISLEDKIKTTELLLEAGANINDLNCVRKHLSKVKGGNLAKFIYPSQSISFIISDVIGDKLDVIASGPTYPDNSTFNDSFNILKKYDILEKIPKNVLKILKDGIEGKIEENPKKGDRIFKNVKNYIIGNNYIALKEIERKGKSLNFNVKLVSKNVKGEAKIVGKKLAKIAIKEKSKKTNNKPLLLIFGGETTVKVKGKGMGGRAQELALSFALNIKNENSIYLLSAGTDGTDGPTDAAGAIVNGKTIKLGEENGLNPEYFLKNNDSYNFFKKINGLFITGPTGTNVMDLYLILIK